MSALTQLSTLYEQIVMLRVNTDMTVTTVGNNSNHTLMYCVRLVSHFAGASIELIVLLQILEIKS